MKHYLKILGFLAVAAGLSFVFRAELAEAAGSIGWRNVSGELRTATRDYSVVAATTFGGANTAGTAGVVVVRAVTTVTSLAYLANTMTLPYPAKIKLVMSDNVGTNDTLVCSVTVFGRNQFGRRISETFAVTETEQKSNRVYESITGTSATGCAEGTDAADVLRIRASNDVGLPFPITSENAVLSVCVYDLSAVNTLCYAPATFVTDLDDAAIDFDTGVVAVAISDRIIFRMRAPAGW